MLFNRYNLEEEDLEEEENSIDLLRMRLGTRLHMEQDDMDSSIDEDIPGMYYLVLCLSYRAIKWQRTRISPKQRKCLLNIFV